MTAEVKPPLTDAFNGGKTQPPAPVAQPAAAGNDNGPEAFDKYKDLNAGGSGKKPKP
jgi:hypothetical protein